MIDNQKVMCRCAWSSFARLQLQWCSSVGIPIENRGRMRI